MFLLKVMSDSRMVRKEFHKLKMYLIGTSGLTKMEQKE